MPHFMPLNVTQGANFINLDLIEKIIENPNGQLQVSFVSKEQMLLGKKDSDDLRNRINSGSAKQAA